jgi:GH24 family phage-related lysozyme (muramidase)
MFKADPGHLFDFSGKKPADIFNEAILPTVNSFLDLLGNDPGGLEDSQQQRNTQLQQDLSREAYSRQEDDQFLANLMDQRQQFAQPVPASSSTTAPEEMDYDSAVSAVSQPQAQPTSPRAMNSNENTTPVAQDLTNFVKHFEGFSSKAFGDYKQTSIGYGTRARKGETTISKEEAESRLAEELSKARTQVEALNESAGYNFKPHEVDALTSFAYNVGNVKQLTGGGKRSREEIASKMLEYNKAGGKVLPGLVKRRTAEHNLFTKGY